MHEFSHHAAPDASGVPRAMVSGLLREIPGGQTLLSTAVAGLGNRRRQHSASRGPPSPPHRPVAACRAAGRLAAWACAARAYVFAPCRGHRTPPQRLKTLISAPHRVGRGEGGV